MKVIDKRARLTLEAREAVFGMIGRGAEFCFCGHQNIGEAVTRAINIESREIEFTISTNGVDSYGDTVQPSGMDNARYRKNPVVQWNHDYGYGFLGGIPVARSLWEKTDETTVTARAKFVPADILPFADTVVRMFAGKFLNAVSIGFWPKKAAKIMKEVDGEEVWTGGFDITDWELLEYSPVPIPANEDALANAVRGLGMVAKSMGMQAPAVGSFEGNMRSASDLIAQRPELVNDPELKEEVLSFASTDDQLKRTEEALQMLAEIREALTAA